MQRSAYRGRIDIEVRRDGRKRRAGTVASRCLGHVFGTQLRNVRAAVDSVASEMIGDGVVVDAEFSGQVS